MVDEAQKIISLLGLEPLEPEGGYFRRTFESKESIGDRLIGTAIYFLITKESFSALHRLKSTEIYHFYAGSSVELSHIYPNGELKTIRFGSKVISGERPQVIVPSGVWQGARLVEGDWALMGATVTPGFDYADFEIGERKALLDQFPQHREVITRLTR